MGQQLTISPIGLRLIKSYEGFRASDRVLVSGQRVVGYGHRVDGQDAMTLTKTAAERLLKADLSLFETMINENVHAPLSQSQFDALCSLAFNIGPKAFLSSEVLHALNNGRPLDAASAFDVWRKSNIDGRTYIVDALVRRRTAEKALFLRPDGRQIPASRIDLPPEADDAVRLEQSAEKTPVFRKDNVQGLVADAPYDTVETGIKGRRREDRLSGPLDYTERQDDPTPREFEADRAPLDLTDVLPQDNLSSETDKDVLELSEKDMSIRDNAVPADETDLLSARANETEQSPTLPNSPIAEAAAEVVEQLDALFDDPDETRKPEIVQNNSEKTTSPTGNLTADKRRNKVKDDGAPVLDQTQDTSQKEGSGIATRDTSAVGDVEGYTSGTLSPIQENTTPYARVANDLSTDGTQQESANSKSAKPLEVTQKVRAEKTPDEKEVPLRDSSEKYIQRAKARMNYETSTDQGPYAVMMVFGLTLIGGFLMTILRGPESLLGNSGPMIAALGFMIGVMIFTGALYYFLRAIFRGRRDSRPSLNIY